MYPDHPQPIPPSQPAAPDYLNQISPQVQKKLPFKPGPRLFIMIGAALVLLVIIISITVSAITAANRQPMEQLAARLSTTERLATAAKDNIKSSKLRSINTSLGIQLTNINRDITDPLAKNGVNIAKLPDSITSKESGDAISTALENARLNGRFDRVYAIEMTHQLSNALTLMRQIKSSASGSLLVFVDDAIQNLEPSQTAFELFESEGN